MPWSNSERTSLISISSDDRAHDDCRQRPAEQLLVTEKVRRILFGRGLADALLIQGVGLAVG